MYFYIYFREKLLYCPCILLHILTHRGSSRCFGYYDDQGTGNVTNRMQGKAKFKVYVCQSRERMAGARDEKIKDHSSPGKAEHISSVHMT